MFLKKLRPMSKGPNGIRIYRNRLIMHDAVGILVIGVQAPIAYSHPIGSKIILACSRLVFMVSSNRKRIAFHKIAFIQFSGRSFENRGTNCLCRQGPYQNKACRKRLERQRPEPCSSPQSRRKHETSAERAKRYVASYRTGPGRVI